MRTPIARLHSPTRALGACLMAGVERDTRDCQLGDQDRFNYYPASPLAAISWIFSGSLHLLREIPEGSAGSASALSPPLPRLCFSGPQRRPTVSWSPGPVHALTVGVYPEAMARLLGQSITPWMDRTVPLDEVAPPALIKACQSVLTTPDQPFARLESEFSTLWKMPPQASTVPYLSDWVRSLATRATLSSAGRSLRQWQRRLRGWTGQSQRDLALFIRIEEAFIRSLQRDANSAPNLADVAAHAGFADQSHMGREIKRVTGVAPASFNERLTADESFWYYRLIAGEFEKSNSDLR